MDLKQDLCSKKMKMIKADDEITSVNYSSVYEFDQFTEAELLEEIECSGKYGNVGKDMTDLYQRSKELLAKICVAPNLLTQATHESGLLLGNDVTQNIGNIAHSLTMPIDDSPLLNSSEAVVNFSFDELVRADVGECEHSFLSKDETGYVCRKCGIFQQRIEAIIQFQSSKNITVNCAFGLPNLTNLIRLELEANGGLGWKFLMQFLDCSPNLQFLIIQKQGQHNFRYDVVWKPPQQVPICLTSNLKEIEILAFSDEAYEVEVIKYLMSNATVLEKMTVSCKGADWHNCVTIGLHNMSSKDCQLNLI